MSRLGPTMPVAVASAGAWHVPHFGATWSRKSFFPAAPSALSTTDFGDGACWRGTFLGLDCAVAARFGNSAFVRN